MIIKELVTELKKCKGNFPVVLMEENEAIQLSREFLNDGSGWAQLCLLVQDPPNLDTEFLKHILDYCNEEEYISLFSDETPFTEFEIVVSKFVSESVTTSTKISKCGIENVDGEDVFALFAEEKLDKEDVKS